MDRKSWNEFINGSHSIYLILPFAVLWAVAPFFGKGMLFACCLGIGAVGFALLSVKDYRDERLTNPWMKSTREEGKPLSPFVCAMTERQGALQKLKTMAMWLFLAEIAAGFLSLTAGGISGRISSLFCCLLPMLTLALYLIGGNRAALIEPESGFANCGFGRIFGREKVCLMFHFAFAAAVWIQWMVTYQRGITLLDRTKWLVLSFGMAAVLSAAFLVFSKEYRSRRFLAPLAVSMALANAFAFVWVVNVKCDPFPAEEYEVIVTDTHLEERIKSIGAHSEDYLTVRYEDESLLDLYEPYDFDCYTEGDRLTVKHHRGALGIEWAAFVQPAE
ncbi:MAG: hypothetical protein IJM51_07840 [Clostridia bacterium]|nr:hypothetical protein [Clostridia bacterium]